MCITCSSWMLVYKTVTGWFIAFYKIFFRWEIGAYFSLQNYWVYYATPTYLCWKYGVDRAIITLPAIGMDNLLWLKCIINSTVIKVLMPLILSGLIWDFLCAKIVWRCSQSLKSMLHLLYSLLPSPLEICGIALWQNVSANVCRSGWMN